MALESCECTDIILLGTWLECDEHLDCEVNVCNFCGGSISHTDVCSVCGEDEVWDFGVCITCAEELNEGEWGEDELI